ncbi:MAG: zinc ribbon domain-containing protein [Clostridia bacterium]|nr:zinc ribbon domain-containing protein [Clostridia bacterium]
MYCKNCGHELDDRAVVCPHCGVPVYDNFNTNGYTPYQEKQKEKVYNVLAIIGFVFSILGFGSIIMGAAGLVCSIIGYRQAAKLGGKGKGLALAGIIISAIAIAVGVIEIVIEILSSVGLYNGGYNYYYDYY